MSRSFATILFTMISGVWNDKVLGPCCKYVKQPLQLLHLKFNSTRHIRFHSTSCLSAAIDRVVFNASRILTRSVPLKESPSVILKSLTRYYTIQYSTIRYSTVQYSTIRYSTAQHSTVQYSTVQYSTVQYSTVQYSTVQYSTVQYSTVQYSTVQYSTVQYSTKQNSSVD